MKIWKACLLTLCLCAFAACALSEEASEADDTALEFALTVEMDIPDLEEFPEIDAIVREWLRGQIAERLHERHDKVSVVRGGMTADEWELRGYSETSQPSSEAISVMFALVEKCDAEELLSIELYSLNFDADNASELSLDDMFGDPDKALEIIARVSVEHLDEWLRAEYPAAYEDGGEAANEEWPTAHLDADRNNFQTLGLDPEGLRVLYQMHQLPSFAKIPTTAVIPIELLEEALPNPRLWRERESEDEKAETPAA